MAITKKQARTDATVLAALTKFPDVIAIRVFRQPRFQDRYDVLIEGDRGVPSAARDVAVVLGKNGEWNTMVRRGGINGYSWQSDYGSSDAQYLKTLYTRPRGR